MSYTLLASLAAMALIIAVLIRRRRKTQRKKMLKAAGACWSIGYQWLDDPFKANPEKSAILSKHNFPASEGVTGVADPFVIRRDGELYLFYEIILERSPEAKIAVSKFNRADQRWHYQGIALDEPFHLSYPSVFEHDSQVYMIPETKGAGAVRLYKAVGFPLSWQFERELISNCKLVDASIVLGADKHYLFASRKRKLYLYYADSLQGEWLPHPQNPIKRRNYARCAGRIIDYHGQRYRFAQEQAKGYGTGVKLYRIAELSIERYREEPLNRELFLQACGDSWARFGMHHVDVLAPDLMHDNQHMVVFDGRGTPGP